MTHIYLHHKALSGDPWTAVPDITAAYPNQVAGALPVRSIAIETGPAVEVMDRPHDASTADDHLLLRVDCVPLPASLANAIVTFLLNFKAASFHEAKHVRYGQGNFMTADLSHIRYREEQGMMSLSFRLAVTNAAALT